MELNNGKPIIFRINENMNGPNLLIQVCLERGWHVYKKESDDLKCWNLWWRTKGFPVSQYNQLNKNQYTNHIPKGFLICRKDNLTRYLKCMKKLYGAMYDFSPETYSLPQDYKQLISICGKQNESFKVKHDKIRNICHDVWICKPVARSRGRGIFLFQSPDELAYSTNVIVQRYVKNPLLIGGYKFDLRLYVLVPSFHPLTIYIYCEGLARFSTEKFSLNNIKNPFAHLTNTSLNKFGPRYGETKERIGLGCKWSLQQLRCYLQQTIGSDWLLWQNISILVVLTLAGYLSKIPPTVNCFEFYGFDILVDSSLKPWLMEVNLSPALCSDSTIDPNIKKPMLHDMFDLLGLPVCFTGLSFLSSPIVNLTSGLTILRRHSSQRESNSVYWNFACTRKYKTNTFNGKKLLKGNSISTLRKCQISPNNSVFSKKSNTVISRGEYANVRNINYIWGNKLNWNFPKGNEGNWVRIFPLLSEKHVNIKAINSPLISKNNTYCTHEIHSVISSVYHYSKIVKEIFSSNQNATDEVLNKLISPYLCENSKIWIPPT